MASASRLGRQIEEIVDALNRMGVPFALIGGLALAPYNVTRATRDVDLLVEGARSNALDFELARLGYRCLHRGLDAANYLRGDERLDFLYATRPMALRLLSEARKLQTSLGEIPVVSVEGLIAFKLQGVVNDPRRTQDLEDIRALIRANRADLGPTPLFANGGLRELPGPVTDPFAALDDLMVVIEALSPSWPARGIFRADGLWLL